jgi:hypothetical protein
LTITTATEIQAHQRAQMSRSSIVAVVRTKS